MFVRLKCLYLLFEKSEDRAKTRVIITARVSGDMVTQGNNSIDYVVNLKDVLWLKIWLKYKLSAIYL